MSNDIDVAEAADADAVTDDEVGWLVAFICRLSRALLVKYSVDEFIESQRNYW